MSAKSQYLGDKSLPQGVFQVTEVAGQLSKEIEPTEHRIAYLCPLSAQGENTVTPECARRGKGGSGDSSRSKKRLEEKKRKPEETTARF